MKEKNIKKQAGAGPRAIWEHTCNEGEMPCHSLVIGGVLCRWWGIDEPTGVRMLDALFPAAPTAQPSALTLEEHTKHVQQFLNDLWACAALLKAAKDIRDKEYEALSAPKASAGQLSGRQWLELNFEYDKHGRGYIDRDKGNLHSVQDVLDLYAKQFRAAPASEEEGNGRTEN